MQRLTLTQMTKATLLLVFSALLTITANADAANICNFGEFWEGLCQTSQDWEAGWYLHPANDPGTGNAVETAYANYEHVIFLMPHSMCIDWRTATCDGTTPPPPPPPPDTISAKKRTKRVANCVQWANTRTSIDGYCLALYANDFDDRDDYNGRSSAARRSFLAGIHDAGSCVAAQNTIGRLGTAYTAGGLNQAQTDQILSAITTVQSWACVTYHDDPPPRIPAPPS